MTYNAQLKPKPPFWDPFTRLFAPRQGNLHATGAGPRPRAAIQDPRLAELWMDAGSSMVLDAARTSEYLATLYDIRHYAALQRFLEGYPAAIDTLSHASKAIQHYFPSAHAAIQHSLDPDIDDEQLVVYIVTSLGASEAVAQFDRFLEEWWFDASEHAPAPITFNLEFA